MIRLLSILNVSFTFVVKRESSFILYSYVKLHEQGRNDRCELVFSKFYWNLILIE